MRFRMWFWGRRPNWARVVIVAVLALFTVNSFLSGWGVVGALAGVLWVVLVLGVVDGVKKLMAKKK